MNPVRLLRRKVGLTQAGLAKVGGTSQPTVAAYEAGRKSPTLDTLRRLAASVGLEATVSYHPPMTREDRRSLALHRAIADRLRANPDQVRATARRNLRRMAAGRSDLGDPLRDWAILLERPLPALLDVLTDSAPWARELRHVTPFAGVLTAEERWAVYREFREQERRSGA